MSMAAIPIPKVSTAETPAGRRLSNQHTRDVACKAGNVHKRATAMETGDAARRGDASTRQVHYL